MQEFENEKNRTFDKKEKFKSFIESKINSLMNRQISPSNIFNFYDDFLNGLVDISDEVLNKYIKETRVPNKSDREKGLQEDEAFKYFNINSIGETIDSMSKIVEKREERLKEMTDEISERSKIDRKVFVPPDREDKFLVTPGNGGWKEREYVPRLLTLIYILENDLDLKLKDNKDITINQGINDKEMMRKESYIRVSIPELNRIVYVCNEECNASFVFDGKIIKENSLSALDLDDYTKINFNELIENNKNVGVRIIQSKYWRERMLTALTKNISEFEKQKSELQSDLESKENIPLKKEGWEGASSLRKGININFNSIKDFAEQYRLTNPEWFRYFKNRNKVSEYYHPDLVILINKKLNQIPNKKTDWENSVSLKKYLKVDYKTVKNFAEKYRSEHSEWFEMQKNLAQISEYFSPELVKVIKNNFKVRENIKSLPKKDGWESISSLSKRGIGVSYKYIKNFAERYRTEHPEWFEIQKPKDGPSAEFFNPELISLLIKEINLNKKIEGWDTASNIAFNYLKTGFVSIKNFTEQYRKDHPDWFKIQKTGSKMTEHYHPDLVKIIKEHFTKR